MAVNFVERIDDAVKIKNILVSVSDKQGLENFILEIVKINPGIAIYSTGGTYSVLEKAFARIGGKNLHQVSDYTGQPEMQGGLVKTLDFRIYLGLLSETYNPAHRKDLERTNAIDFDMVIVNLYPFGKTIAKPGVTPEESRANIDIGGPCMVRASAKNFLRVASVTDPSDYPKIIEEMTKTGGNIGLATRYGLAQKAFRHTGEYDTMISEFLAGQSFDEVRNAYTFGIGNNR
jgi:phosphoribosylaminoimidazolecarboxamide formyltransferase/IMP cyclohydrolase